MDVKKLSTDPKKLVLDIFTKKDADKGYLIAEMSQLTGLSKSSTEYHLRTLTEEDKKLLCIKRFIEGKRGPQKIWLLPENKKYF